MRKSMLPGACCWLTPLREASELYPSSRHVNCLMWADWFVLFFFLENSLALCISLNFLYSRLKSQFLKTEVLALEDKETWDTESFCWDFMKRNQQQRWLFSDKFKKSEESASHRLAVWRGGLGRVTLIIFTISDPFIYLQITIMRLPFFHAHLSLIHLLAL